MKQILIILLLFLSLNSFSQEKTYNISLQSSDKSVSLYPFYKTFSVSFDPAVSIGVERFFYTKGNSSLFYSGQFSWYNHRMIGAGFSSAICFGYQYKIQNGLYVEPKLGAGFNLFYPERETFIINQSGQYEATKSLHNTFLGLLGLSLGYEFGKLSVFCNYQYSLEGKYNEILPILPTSMFGVGVKYQFLTKKD
ncbi:MAG: hypothetical protein JXL97_01870 [Bacteroidales bacterium]|nr:hypothetical protein [Bacteroidales bacterium]